jgi:hypothetical protein
MTTFTATTTIETSNGAETFRHDPRVEVYVHNSAAYVRCTLCERGDYARRHNPKAGHKSWCDLRDVETFSDKPAPKSTVSASTIRRAAREGAISAVATDDEIVGMVRTGHLSMSDAMNRDF